MNDSNKTFRLLKQNSIIVFFGVCIIALLNQTGCKKSETSHSDYILATTDETPIHEAAHYVCYVASMRQAGCTPEPQSIQVNSDGSGQFVAKSYCNSSTKIVSTLAGYAAVCVFYNLDPSVVFQKIQGQPDFKAAAALIGSDRDLQYKNFLVAIEWVKTYKNSILNFSQRLKNEKSIKF